MRQLGDVQQALLAGQNLDEGTKGHDPLDDSVVLLTHLGVGRDPLNHAPRLFGRAGFNRGNGNRAVFVHIDRGPGFFDLADGLAARADDRADFALVNFDELNARCPARKLGPRRAQAFVHNGQDLFAPLFGAVEGLLKNVERQALDFNIHLDRGNPVLRASDLEVHVAEKIFGVADVGQQLVLVPFLDQAHARTAHRGFDRNSGVHQGEGAATHRGHRAGAARLGNVGHQPNRVGKGLDRWDDRL